MRDVLSEPIWIVALMIMLGALSAAVLIATKRLSAARERRLRKTLAGDKSFAPEFKEEDENQPRIRPRGF